MIIEEMKKEPLLFHPNLKSVIWGGTDLYRLKGLPVGDEPAGESWEVSAIPGHESVVAAGDYAGMSLGSLIERFGTELLGSGVVRRYGFRFPLLVKIIDAHDNLSMQVHPDDEMAQARHGSPGKTEMWYICSSTPGAKIYTGFNRAIDREEYMRRVADATLPEVVASYESHGGDIFFIPAGRVHAIGAGNLLVEIQESSDITYRIFDYDRRDASGKPRELHTALAADALDFRVSADYRTTPSPRDAEGVSGLVDCSHFRVSRIDVCGSHRVMSDGESSIVLVCTAGTLTIEIDGKVTQLSAGNSALCPACMTRDFRLIGDATVIAATA